VHPAISEAIRTAGRYLSAAGFAVEEAAPPDIDAVADLWHVFGVTENLEALWPRVEQMGDDDARRSMTHWRAFRPAATLERYFAAHLERDAYLQRWNDFFLQYPIVIMPNSGEPAFPQRLDAGDFADAERALIANRFQLPAAVLGLPGLSVPVGSVDGVPLGVQINANRYREDLCLLAGEVIEACEGPRTPIDPVR
jgi:amidase